MERCYLCIDLKTFYASVECVARGLDPFTTNLVVADASKGKGAICLAISPALKKLGIKNRCRLLEIPDDIKYIAAMPRMKKYMEKSAEIYGIYLKYVSKEDILVYSIDECFLDVTTYLKLYNKTAKALAKMIIEDVVKTTGITATVGIGTNLFLAKVALDITAKHSEDNMGYLDEELFKLTIWHHKPITDIWNIGRGIANRLLKYGVTDLCGVTKLDEKILYQEFGVNAEFLIDHAYGVEPCTIKEIHSYRSKNNSLSNSQILPEDYNYDDAFLILKEMIELNVLSLVEKGLVTNSISLYIGYSKDIIKPTGGSYKLGIYTNSYQELKKNFEDLFFKTTDKKTPIRRIGVGLNNVVDESFLTVDLFTNLEQLKKENDMQKAILGIKKRYGKNAILKGMNLEEKATTKNRNKLIGGHNGE